MAKEILGETIDIHCGGADHIPVHHTNEIAQSECAHGKPFAHYWMHGEFLVDAGGKISKSRGEFLTLQTLIEKGYDPIAYRYLCLMTHYRKQLMFSFDALDAAAKTLTRIRDKTYECKSVGGVSDAEFISNFKQAIADDLNMPQALAILQKVLARSTLSNEVKYATIIEIDSVLGLNLAEYEPVSVQISAEIQALLDERAKARAEKDFAKSDELRDKIAELGFVVKDSKDGQKVEKN